SARSEFRASLGLRSRLPGRLGWLLSRGNRGAVGAGSRCSAFADASTTSPILDGSLFLWAGLYQFTSLKQTCLRHCRSPFAFVLNHWRDGRAGALRMG